MQMLFLQGVPSTYACRERQTSMRNMLVHGPAWFLKLANFLDIARDSAASKQVRMIGPLRSF